MPAGEENFLVSYLHSILKEENIARIIAEDVEWLNAMSRTYVYHLSEELYKNYWTLSFDLDEENVILKREPGSFSDEFRVTILSYRELVFSHEYLNGHINFAHDYQSFTHGSATYTAIRNE